MGQGWDTSSANCRHRGFAEGAPASVGSGEKHVPERPCVQPQRGKPPEGSERITVSEAERGHDKCGIDVQDL